MCCHNRKPKTLRCLEDIFNQKRVDKLNLRVVLVDDGSSDGTWEVVSKKYPEVCLVKGSGSLFWSGGMRLAYEKASKDTDFYLWLNDDTELFDHAIIDIYRLSESFKEDVIVTGAVKSTDSGQVAYGGMKRDVASRLRFSILEPFEKTIDCDATNGNCVLIPRRVYEAVGGIDPLFLHAHGDIDFGLRARNKGFRIVLSKKYVGKCDTKFLEERVYQGAPGLSRRMELIFDMKGLHPKEWWYLCMKHCPASSISSFVSPYIRVIRKRPVGFVRRPK